MTSLITYGITLVVGLAGGALGHKYLAAWIVAKRAAVQAAAAAVKAAAPK
jgi:hypothetical protein